MPSCPNRFKPHACTCLYAFCERGSGENPSASEGDETIRPEHLEAALAELLADFS